MLKARNICLLCDSCILTCPQNRARRAECYSAYAYGLRESNALLVGASEAKMLESCPLVLNKDLASCYNRAKRMNRSRPPSKVTDPGRSIWQLETLGRCLHLAKLSHGLLYTVEVMQATTWSSGNSYAV